MYLLNLLNVFIKIQKDFPHQPHFTFVSRKIWRVLTMFEMLSMKTVDTILPSNKSNAQATP